MICDKCKRPENEWEDCDNPFTFVFTLKGESNQRCYCPKCTLERLIELSRVEK